MTVKVAQGDPCEIILPVNTLVGGSTGHTFPIAGQPTVWTALAQITFAITATATVGNRGFAAAIKDAAGNVVSVAQSTINQTAGQSLRYSGGPTQAPYAFGTQGLTFPSPAMIPPGGSVQIFDTNNVDPNDFINSNGVLVYTQ